MFDSVDLHLPAPSPQYGPMNCEFVWRGTNQPIFDEVTLPTVSGKALQRGSAAT